MKSVTALIVAGSLVSSASAGIRISEWMYQGANGEFIEIVNIGAAAVDLTGWSFDDDSRLPGSFDLSPLGILAPGEAAVITENTEAAFRAAWGLAASVKVVGNLTNNLSRNDEINIYNASDVLVDRLTYGDQNFPGTIRTQNKSGWNTPVGTTPWGNVTTDWVFSAIADAQGSWAS
ncbi:MAG TPA: lamin tail domain-containing protein, partial [Phycisphaerales bacterium]|nr:lamin tail domain-containing protein [Phycisphaerales bacterium]